MAELCHRTGRVEWGVAGRPFPGERVSGDRHAVVAWQDRVLVAVIDALGHGAAAESTARRASDILERHAHEALPLLIERCHRALLGDRGAVMGAAVIDSRRDVMDWAGVGNISGLLLHPLGGHRAQEERLVAPAGIVGSQLPALHAESLVLTTGDLVVLATDGLRESFVGGIVPPCSDPQRLAERLILDHATESDDALVLIVRYLGHA